VAVKPGEKDAIIGDPIGRDGLLVGLDAKMTAYSPKELAATGEN